MQCGESRKIRSTLRATQQTLIDYFEAELFDHRVRKDFLGDALGLRLSVLSCKAVEIDNKELALADVFDGAVAKSGEGMLDGLALRIENSALRHNPNVCFHAGIIAERPASEGGSYKTVDFCEGSNANAWVKLVSIREKSSASERPMRWALRYSVARSVWNMVG